MGLAVISWERLEQNESTGEAAWVPYPLEVAARLEAVFLSHQVCVCAQLMSVLFWLFFDCVVMTIVIRSTRTQGCCCLRPGHRAPSELTILC
jgi:hypothetical protein